MGRFFGVLLSVVCLLLILGLILDHYSLWDWTYNVLYTLLFIAGLTFLIHFLNAWALKMTDQGSVIIILLGMVVKLLIGGSFVLFLIYLYPDKIFSTVVSFFSFYIIFTALEIYNTTMSIRG